MIWDDAKIVAADLETSGEITHEDLDTKRPASKYALQPWMRKTGKAWVTSASMLQHDGQNLVPHTSQLFPDKAVLKRMLEDALANDWTILGWNIAFDISWLMSFGPDMEDLCLRLRWLDGMLIWRHLEIEPEYEFSSQRHKKKRYRLKPEAVQQFIPSFAGLDEDVDFHARDQVSLDKLQKYNDRDNVRAWVISKMLWGKLTDQQQRAVLIEAESLPMVAQANLHGIPIDRLAVRHLSAKLDMDAAARLAELAPDGMREDIVRSPTKLAALMFDEWKLPVLKENKSKIEGKPNSRSTDKEVLHELAFIDVRAKKVKQYREALNAKGKFCTSVLESLDYNGDGHSHPTAGIFRTYCVPGTTEVLTREGWVALQDWSGGDIMQAREDGTMDFLPAERFVGPETSEWVQIDHSRLSCLFTPGHTMPYISQLGAWKSTQAGTMLSGTDRKLPVAGKFQGAGRQPLGGRIAKLPMQILAAVQADGYFRPNGSVVFTFEKLRKIERLRNLLQSCGVTHREYRCAAYPGRVEFHIGKKSRPQWMRPERKQLGPWVLDADPVALRAFVEELRYWDGSEHKDGGFRYVSAVEENVLWATTAAALVGIRASAHVRNADGMFSAHFSEGPATIMVRPDRHCSEARKPLRAYCATTQTGYWLARSGRHIFITGNTGRMTVDSKQGRGKNACQIGFALHQMKREEEFREIVCTEGPTETCPEGYDILEFDAAGQEFRWMAIASGDPTMLGLCMPGEDAHSFMGARIVGSDYRALVAANAAGDKTAKQNRYLGKFANLSLQYRTSPRKLRIKARVDYDIPMELPEAQRIHKTYQQAYPGVPHYWERQIAIVKQLGFVETFGGNRVQIIGDWNGNWGWSMGSTAINYRIQGTGADQKHLAMMVIKDYLRQIGGRFLFDLHDGLYLLVPTSKSYRACVDIKRMLDNLPYQEAWGFTPPIPMPWDCKRGKAWGRLKEVHFD